MQSLESLMNKGKKMSYSEEHIKKIADTQRKRMRVDNPMNNPESRLKISLSKIGRKRVNMPDGTYKMIHPEINTQSL